MFWVFFHPVDALRRILCQVGLQNGPDGENSLVDTLMLCDSKMWKGAILYVWDNSISKTTTLKSFQLKAVIFFVCLGARNVYHQLFMSSLLMDLKYKKLFAIQFAKVSCRVQVAIHCSVNKHAQSDRQTDQFS